MKKKIAAILLSMAVMTAASACGGNGSVSDREPNETTAARIENTDSETESTEASSDEISEEVTEETAEETTTAALETIAPRPAEIPFDNDAYTEFAEPVAYNVINDTVAYADSALVTVEREIPAGGMVIGLGSDENYIITDAQEFVPLADLETMQ